MKAVMLAAGVARRLYGDENDNLPKALLEFEGRTLLARHIEILRQFGVDELVMVVGHRKEDLYAEIEAVSPDGFVRTVFNPRYKEVPILSLAAAAGELRSGDEALFMDADVLYHPELMRRAIESPFENCFIMDREFEPDSDPVKLCLRDGELIDFGKQVTDDYDVIGEWPGFLKMSAEIAAKIADSAERHAGKDEMIVNYEPAMREVLVTEPVGTFGVEDITGIPWIEIDFPSDLIRAEEFIYPEVVDFIVENEDAGEESPLNNQASAE